MKLKKNRKKDVASADELGFPPEYVKAPFAIQADADGDAAVFYAHIKPLMDSTEHRAAALNSPDRQQRILEYLQMSDEDVSDAQFFIMIEDDPIFLSSRFAIQKIKRWQQEMNGFVWIEGPGGALCKGPISDIKRDKAKDYLLKIGSTLALNNPERLQTEHIVRAHYNDILAAIKEKKISRKRTDTAKRLLLKEMFLEEICNEIKDIPRTDKDLALTITSIFVGKSRTTVKSYIAKKRTKEVKLGDITAIQRTPTE